ncbi:hypothetical protein ABLV49_24190 (plasmid) [Polaromonas hydrogenivorans]|uniref:Uncharacterized protein n=1 Tax=Polaromonas hydrogenivorans TaxID=335476 RepID=A0AAU7LZF8_9BURK
MHSAAALDENFGVLLAEFTAGDPMREGVLGFREQWNVKHYWDFPRSQVRVA